MTQKQLIELIQQHHSGMGETEIRLALNRAQDNFCSDTELITATFTQDSVAGQRYYNLDDAIVEITRVDYDNYEIPRLVGEPEKMDTT